MSKCKHTRRELCSKAQPCAHKLRLLCTEADGCYWLACLTCKARGPKRHSATLAIKSARNNMRIRPATHSRQT